MEEALALPFFRTRRAVDQLTSTQSETLLSLLGPFCMTGNALNVRFRPDSGLRRDFRIKGVLLKRVTLQAKQSKIYSGFCRGFLVLARSDKVKNLRL